MAWQVSEIQKNLILDAWETLRFIVFLILGVKSFNTWIFAMVSSEHFALKLCAAYQHLDFEIVGMCRSAFRKHMIQRLFYHEYNNNNNHYCLYNNN